MLTIDGSTLEGGGQLTRMALCLSAITRIPVRIHSIRAGRAASGRSARRNGAGKRSAMGSTSSGAPTSRKGGGHRHRDRDKGAATPATPAAGVVAGGLKDSHLAALEFLAEQCNARVQGASVGSTEVVFRPSPLPSKAKSSRPANPTSVQSSTSSITPPKEHTISLTKPGSIWLIFQAIYPFLAFSTDWTPYASNPTEPAIILTLRGGTNVSKAMSTDYVTQVFAPFVERVGLPGFEVETIKRGWAGNASEIGEVVVRIYPPLPPLKTGLVDSSDGGNGDGKADGNGSGSENRDEGTNRDGRLILPTFNLSPSHDPNSSNNKITKISISLLCTPPSTFNTLLTTLISLLSIAFPTTRLSVHTNESSLDPRRLYILLTATTSDGYVLGYDYLGSGGKSRNAAEEKKKLEVACESVVRGLEREVKKGGVVDAYLADQVVVFQALARGSGIVSSDGNPQTTGKDGGGDIDGNGNGVDENENADLDEDGNAINPTKIASVGDQSGTLHARTVRWVCETMLAEYGVRFESAGVCHGVEWNSEDCRKVVEGKDDDLGLGGLDIKEDPDSE